MTDSQRSDDPRTDQQSSAATPRDGDRTTADADQTDLMSSRRGILAAVAAVGGGGMALSHYGGFDLLDGEGSGDNSTSGDEELLLDKEADHRSQLHSHRESTTPSFEYEQFSEQFDDPAIPVNQVSAAAAPDGTGDRLVFVIDSDQVEQLGTAIVGFWTDVDDSQTYSTTIDDTALDFEIYAGGSVSVGGAVRPASDSESHSELLVARGTDEQTVTELLDTFVEFYT